MGGIVGTAIKVDILLNANNFITNFANCPKREVISIAVVPAPSQHCLNTSLLNVGFLWARGVSLALNVEKSATNF